MTTVTGKDQKKYTIEEAIKLAKQSCRAKFDSTVEVHCNLKINVTKADQIVRFTTTLPHGTGKNMKVAVFASKKVANADLELSETDLDKILKNEIKPKVDFNALVAEPKFMPKLAKVARVLGPMGLMPNPKAGTVTEDVQKAVEQLKKGKIEIKNEQKAPIIHTIIGKKSFDDQKLRENFVDFYKSLRQNKPQKAKPDWISTCFVSTTMGSSYEVDLANTE